MPQSYDPKLIVIIYGGMILSGYADGTFGAAKRASDKMTPVVSSDGKVTVVRSADDSGEITITLQASSLSNDYLSAKAVVQALPGPLVAEPLFIKDLLGTTLISAAQAWIKKVPDVEFGKELSNREWVFGVENLQMVVGGNL